MAKQNLKTDTDLDIDTDSMTYESFEHKVKQNVGSDAFDQVVRRLLIQLNFKKDCMGCGLPTDILYTKYNVFCCVNCLDKAEIYLKRVYNRNNN